MPEHLRTLLVILVLAGITFVIARRPLCPGSMTEQNFLRRRNLWLSVTLIAFLAHDFWVYSVLAAFLLLVTLSRESNKLALYFGLMFAVPPIAANIDGMGIVEHFFSLDYLRLLALTILTPMWWSLRKEPGVRPFGTTATDKFLLAFLAMQFVQRFEFDTTTNAFRFGFYYFTDVFLPYYVASRAVKDIGQFREALAMFVLAAMVMAVLGLFEVGRHWLLYAPLPEALGIEWDYGRYLGRGDTLRALVSTGHPIVLGFVMVVALGFYGFLWRDIPGYWKGAGLLVLLGGLIAPISRGPWVGALLLAFLFMIVGARPVRQLIEVGIGFTIVSAILFISPVGRVVMEYLPFIGTVDTENVIYREKLISNSWILISRNPFFGDPYNFYFTPEMEEMRQGQGIIDVVNTYLVITLNSGFVGLFLYLGALLASLAGIGKGMLLLSDRNADTYRLGQALLATLMAILVVITTVSSILVIQTVTWVVVGLGVAYSRMVAERSSREKAFVT